jgi:hypothetical protein
MVACHGSLAGSLACQPGTDRDICNDGQALLSLVLLQRRVKPSCPKVMAPRAVLPLFDN